MLRSLFLTVPKPRHPRSPVLSSHPSAVGWRGLNLTCGKELAVAIRWTLFLKNAKSSVLTALRSSSCLLGGRSQTIAHILSSVSQPQISVTSLASVKFQNRNDSQKPCVENLVTSLCHYWQVLGLVRSGAG